MRSFNIKNLFIIACLLKVTSALLGWYLGFPWLLGFIFPLVIMVTYMVLGAYKGGDDVRPEKFADSCYYLGFIFTIASISIALIDLPNIGNNIQDIAVRFGAAMISTVLGLSVRVAMVTFRKDINDAIKNTEESIVDTSLRLKDQFENTLVRLRDFESSVDHAAKMSVERVNLQIESLSKNYAEKLAEFFEQLAKSNQESFKYIFEELKTTNSKLTESVDTYALGMRANLTSIEEKVVAFSEAITERLKNTTFPDDYFANNLQEPLRQLSEAAEKISDEISNTAENITETTDVLSTSLRKLRERATRTESSLEAVARLATQQQLLLEESDSQITQLAGLNQTIQTMHGFFEAILQQLQNSNEVTHALNLGIKKSEQTYQEKNDEIMQQLSITIVGFEQLSVIHKESNERFNASLDTLGQRMSEFGLDFKNDTTDLINRLDTGFKNHGDVADLIKQSTQKIAEVVSTLESLSETTFGKISNMTDHIVQIRKVTEELNNFAQVKMKIESVELDNIMSIG